MKPKSHNPDHSVQYRINMVKKLPEITLLFWIVKLLTTGMGETTSDYLAHHLSPVIAVALGGIGLSVTLLIQFSVRKYVPWVYWLAIIMVAIFGTMIADVIHVKLGISYLASTVGFSVLLGIVFAVWYATEKTLSIHHIYTFQRELFYWATVMATFALGTAAGDMTASTLGMGYFASALLFAVLFALPALVYWRSGFNTVGAFWLAYIMTRPLGASVADWLGKPQERGGVGFGTGPTSLVLAIIIAGFVAYVTYFGKGHKQIQ